MRRLPVLEPITKGLLLAFFSVAFASLGGAFFLGALPPASPRLLQNLSTIGTILVPAYVVEAVWLSQRMSRNIDYEEWLGFAVGSGICGLLAIAIALLLGEHRAAGHSNWLDDLGLSWAVVAEVILASVLILQPLLAERLRGSDD